MKKYFLLVLCLLSVDLFAQTRAIVPRADGEGAIGDGTTAWGTGYFNRVYVNSSQIAPVPFGSTGINQVATWNGTNWVASAIGAPPPSPVVGTNVKKFVEVWGITNTWIAPTTQILFTAWGAGGGNCAGGAGHVRALWVGPAGTAFDIVVGTAGNAAATNNGPFAGYGLGGSATQTNSSNGGGATYITISGNTNIILIAAGSGGGGSVGTAIGGPGGFWFGSTDGQTASGGTNVSYGLGAWSSNEYGLAATAGTNFANGDTKQNGGFLRGGSASTNGANIGVTAVLGGGGGGWYGGAGASKTSTVFGSSSGSGGGGGLCYVSTNYFTFAQIFAGEKANQGSPAGQDHPTYTSGRGIGGVNAGGNGANGCAGAMW